MTIDRAIRILDPKTSNEAMDDIEQLHGLDATDWIILELKEACELACKALRFYKESGES